MTDTVTTHEAPQLVLGDEAVALGALHAGLSAAYGYPGTPSTEAMEYLIGLHEKKGGPLAQWCANEKTAYESALGAAYAGRRALVTMKHVGLNVAADPFVNSALLSLHGGLVVLVADDPGMHSSQNEQDSRILADFAKVPVLEPSSVQEAYDMARAAFGLSEKHGVPVLMRMVTRLAHTRAPLRTRPPRVENPSRKAQDPSQWNLLPHNARRQWKGLLRKQNDLEHDAEQSPFNRLELADCRLGVITTGNALGYFLENAGEMGIRPSHLHIGQYPVPIHLLRKLAQHADRLLVLEDGQPYLERQLSGVLTRNLDVQGRLTGAVPLDGELDPDKIRRALKLPERETQDTLDRPLVGRPPQLCQGCSHRGTYTALNQALAEYPDAVVTSDIGCYTLGALPPYESIETCVAMGASIGMAKGASEAGLRPAVAVIGDGTFLHTGLNALMDAVHHDTDMTVLILDNSTVGMTGHQDPVLPEGRIEALCRAMGVREDHLHVLHAHPKNDEENTEAIRAAVEQEGLSVLIMRRPCIQAVRKWKKEGRA